MENTIATRIADFLKAYPPFNFLNEALLLKMSARAVVQYFQPEEIIFHQDDIPNDHFYIVREGAVHLIRVGEQEELIDECGEGDVFGIRPLIAKQPYLLTAKVEEECLLYGLPIQLLEDEIQRNSRLAFYLATVFAAGVRSENEGSFRGKIFLNQPALIAPEFRLTEVQTIERSKKPITCRASTTVQEAAKIMSYHGVGSILVVNDKNHPIGIVTDRDFRNKVVTGQIPVQVPISTMMNSPVITIPETVTVADVQIEMVKHQIHHLCITEDGTDESPVTGVISEHDLLVIQGNNPAILVREIYSSQSPKEMHQIRLRAEELLQNYIYQEVSIAFISTIMSEINDAVIVRCIEMSLAEMIEEDRPYPGVDFCWLSLGSEGREEQLLRTDQDSALVFDNVNEADYEAIKSYFLTFSEKVTQKLNQVGFAYCPADMMASNPKWCLSLSEWKDLFSEWVNQPNADAILHSNIFFDFRPVFGNANLSKELTKHIFSDVEKQRIFLAFMAKNALKNPPPLSFFRNFVVEKGGEHKDEFDIKKRAMMPLVDAARVLTIEAKVSGVNNTFKRFEQLAELDPANQDLFEQAADAYEILMRYRTLQGLKNKDSGRYFKPSELNKMQRAQLRNSFRPINELQSLLKVRFQLSYIQG